MSEAVCFCEHVEDEHEEDGGRCGADDIMQSGVACYCSFFDADEEGSDG